MTPTDIKSLAIALEALSRIPKVDDLSSRIESLLTKAINQVEDRHIESTPVPPVYSRPPKVPYAAPASVDDDTPF